MRLGHCCASALGRPGPIGLSIENKPEITAALSAPRHQRPAGAQLGDRLRRSSGSRRRAPSSSRRRVLHSELVDVPGRRAGRWGGVLVGEAAVGDSVCHPPAAKTERGAAAARRRSCSGGRRPSPPVQWRELVEVGDILDGRYLRSHAGRDAAGRRFSSVRKFGWVGSGQRPRGLLRTRVFARVKGERFVGRYPPELERPRR